MSSPSDFSPIFQAFAADCTAGAIQQQDLVNEFLGTHHRNLDLTARTLTGNGLVIGGVTGLGSFSHLSQTWLWMWDNPGFDWEHPAVAPVRMIYRLGERQGIPELTTGHLDLAGFPNPHGAATTLAIASAYVLGGQGIWSCRINDGKGSTYVHLDDPQLPVAQFDPAAAPALLARAAEVWPREQRAVVRGMLRHFNMASNETPDQIAGRHPSGAVLAVAFDPVGNITAISSDAAGRGDHAMDPRTR